MSFVLNHLATQYKLNRKTNINLVIYGQFRILFYISFLSRGLIHVISLLHQTFHIKLVGDSQFLHMDGLLQDLNENQAGQLQMQLITHKYVMLTGNHGSPLDFVITKNLKFLQKTIYFYYFRFIHKWLAAPR